MMFKNYYANSLLSIALLFGAASEASANLTLIQSSTPAHLNNARTILNSTQSSQKQSDLCNGLAEPACSKQQADNVAAYLRDPVNNAAKISYVIDRENHDGVASMHLGKAEIAQKVISQCTGAAQQSVKSFNNCAHEIASKESLKLMGITSLGLGTVALSVWGVAGYRHRRKYGYNTGLSV